MVPPQRSSFSVLLAAAVVACVPAEGPAPLPGPDEGPEPEVRVGLVTGASAVTLGGGDPLTLWDETNTPILQLDRGGSVRLTARGDRISLGIGSAAIGPVLGLTVRATTPGGTVRVGEREYRGIMEGSAASGALQVVNRLGIEAYLAGVVNAEMGRRAENETEALRAQAIVSRTFAFKLLGRYRRLGYDVLATVADQAYTGASGELPQGREAVAATRGTVLIYDGEVIDAFFHSTCGGRTADGEEIFANARRPYLRSVSDEAPDGSSWCAISPRYRWRESWTARTLSALLAETLPALGVPGSAIGVPRSVEVTERTNSGRVAELTIQLDGRTVPLRGGAVRQALGLRSANFRLSGERAGGHVESLVADGGGAGHGVGLCQWGTVGRARAGHSAESMLAAYFPGTTLSRRW